MQIKYYSTKRFGPISTGHRQWRDSGACKFIHGYGRYVELVFACNRLDDKGWVISFGSLKYVREWLDQQWDHRTLLSDTDPRLIELLSMPAGTIDINVMDSSKGHGPGMEQSCKFVYDWVNPIIREGTNSRCWVHSVRIWEHDNNSAMLVAESE